jgi:thiol-disulfide isomerase/thioredoxin
MPARRGLTGRCALVLVFAGLTRRTMRRLVRLLLVALTGSLPPAWAQFDRQVLAQPAALPAFTLQDLSGKPWHLSHLRGRSVVLNFWATWCAPCRQELPSLQTLAELLGTEHTLVLAVNVKEAAPLVQRFATRTALGLPVLLDHDGALAKRLGIHTFPTTLLIDRQGRTRERVVGEVNWSGPQALTWVEALHTIK